MASTKPPGEGARPDQASAPSSEADTQLAQAPQVAGTPGGLGTTELERQREERRRLIEEKRSLAEKFRDKFGPQPAASASPEPARESPAIAQMPEGLPRPAGVPSSDPEPRGRKERNRNRHKPSERLVIKPMPVTLPPELEAERLRDRARHQAAWLERFGKPEDRKASDPLPGSLDQPAKARPGVLIGEVGAPGRIAHLREHEDWARSAHPTQPIDRTAVQLIGRALRERRIEAVDRRHRHVARLWAGLLHWIDQTHQAEHAAALQRPPSERRMAELIVLGHAPEALIQHAESERGRALKLSTSGPHLDPDRLLLSAVEAWEPHAPRPLRAPEGGSLE